jgi:uracil-DNA glycosylase
MIGTKMIISNILQYEKDEALKHYVMTNSCKCTRADTKSMDQLPEFFYEQCAEYKIKEIAIVEPDIIYLQGKRALIGLKFESIEGLTIPFSEYLKYLVIGNIKYFAVQCIHPSARGRHAQRKKVFYNHILPKINDFLKAKLDSKFSKLNIESHMI